MASTIIVTGFTQKYVKGPGDTSVAVDMVTWVPRHAPLSMKNTERVDRLNPANLRYSEDTEQADDKRAHMNVLWSQIEPAYLAWKEGREVPMHGTPLAVWPGITSEQADVFRIAGIRTVEDVRDMDENHRSRVNLPNTRELRELARIYLENSGAAAAAEREAAKDQQIADMASQNETMAAQIAELQKALLERPNSTPVTESGSGEGRTNAVDPEVLALREQLDARGITYHHSNKAPKLRELLATGGREAA